MPSHVDIVKRELVKLRRVLAVNYMVPVNVTRDSKDE